MPDSHLSNTEATTGQSTFSPANSNSHNRESPSAQDERTEKELHRQSEQTMTDLALQESRQRLQALFDHALNGILLASDDGRYLDANPAACAMLGYTRDEILTMSGFDLYRQEEGEVRARELWKQFQQQGRMRGVITLVHKEGFDVTVEFSAVMNVLPGVHLSVLSDVSEIERAKQALQESEEHLRFAMEAADFGDWDMDLRTNVARRSFRHDQLFGYSEPVPIWGYDTFLAHVHPDDRQRVDENYRAAMEGKGNYDVVFRAVWPDGSIHWLWSKGRFYHDAEGKPCRVAGIQADVTEREQAKEALRESADFATAVLNSLAANIAVLDAKGNIVAVNEDYLCFSRENDGVSDLKDILGTNYFTVCERSIASGKADFANEALEGILAVLNGRLPVFSLEYPCHSPDQLRWFMMRATPLSVEGRGVVVAHEDITQRHQLLEQLFESQKLESLGRLAGGVAHDFNNLLTAIMGYTELTMLSLPEDAEILAFLENIKLGAERAAELTKQLLMYARRQMVEFVNIDINAIILELDPLLRRTIGEQYELVTLLTEDRCIVNSNASQIEQVVMNLVVNARDSMPNGGRILIETSCMTLENDYVKEHIGVMPGEYVMFSVSDNGMGMTREVQDRIFEPFYTTKEVGKGTGLGLATCYGIVKQSKGNIWVYSEPGKGTTFKVYLPRVLEASHSEPVKLPDNLPEGIETVLLVDDEPMVRDIAARTLRGKGYRVLEASNGAEALHLQSEWPGEIDLLITDVVMPLMGGKELGQRLQELRPDMKVLYISGYTQNVVLQQGVLGSDRVLLTKPFNTEGLFRKVREALQRE